MSRGEKISIAADEKKILVSFKSDSEDESNTSSSSSPTSSTEDSSGSDNEKESSAQKAATPLVSAVDEKKDLAKSDVKNHTKISSVPENNESGHEKEKEKSIKQKSDGSLQSKEKQPKAAGSTVIENLKGRCPDRLADNKIIEASSEDEKEAKQSKAKQAKKQNKKLVEETDIAKEIIPKLAASASDSDDNLPDLSKPKKNSAQKDTAVISLGASSKPEDKENLIAKSLKDSKYHSKSTRKDESEEAVLSSLEKNNPDTEKITALSVKESKHRSKSPSDAPAVEIQDDVPCDIPVVDVDEDETLTVPSVKVSKHRSKSSRDAPAVEDSKDESAAVPIVDVVGQQEDQTLDVSSVKASKHRSKSPREPPAVDLSDDVTIANPVINAVSQSEDQNLSVPSAKVSKHRSKSPREPQAEDISESIVTNKISSRRKNESVSPVPDSFTNPLTSKGNSEDNSELRKSSKSRPHSSRSLVDEVVDDDVKNEKRGKKIEAEIIENLEAAPEIIDESLSKPIKKKKKKQTETEVAEDDDDKLVSKEEVVIVIQDMDQDLKLSKSSKKKSTKDKTANDHEVTLNYLGDDEKVSNEKGAKYSKRDPKSDSDVDIQVTATVTDFEETTKAKKKSRKTVDDLTTTVIDTPTDVNEAKKEENYNVDEDVIADKPKKKKLSKSAVGETTKLGELESVEAIDSDNRKHKASGIVIEFNEKEHGKKSLEISKDITGEELLTQTAFENKSVGSFEEPSENINCVSPQTITILLEEAIQEKCDVVILNEIQELPNTEFSSKIVKPMSEIELLLEEARLMTSSGTKETEEKVTMENTSSEVEIKSSSNIDKLKVPGELEFSLKNEESDLSSRRRSMDDFIKKILAEAREENKALQVGATKEIVADSITLDEKSDRQFIPTAEDEKAEDGLTGRRSVKKNGVSRNVFPEDDDDVDFSRLRNNKRQPKKVFDDMEVDDSISPPSERGSGRPTYRSTRCRDYLDDEEMLSSSAVGAGRPPLRRGRLDLDDKEEAPAAGESFLAKFRREKESSTLPEDLFKPKRSDETADVVQDKTRNIRTIVEQQTDCARTFKLTKRDLDLAENEMREVRQLSLDWRARIEALESALDVEYQTYETDLQVATDRLYQQHMPDDRYLREEFGNQQAERLRRLEKNQNDSGPEVNRSPFSRRRSGSVTSMSNYPASSYLSQAGGGGVDMGSDRIGGYSSGQMYGEVGVGGGRWNSDVTSSGRESDLSSYVDRSRREESLTRRDRYTVDMNTPSSSYGFGKDDDRYLSSPSRSGSAHPYVDMSTQPSSRSDAVMKIRAKYASLDETRDGYVTPIRLRSTSRDSTYGSSMSSDYLTSEASRGYGGSRRDPYSPAPFSDYTSSSYTPSRYSSGGSGTYGSSSLCYYPDRDTNNTRPLKSYESTSSFDYPNANTFDEPTVADYQNKFLSRVRGGSAASLGAESRSATSQSSAEAKPFKSRFLKSTTIV